MLFPKQTTTLTAEVERIIDSAPETTTFTWSSSDETIVTVSAKGMITAVSTGEATITCSASDDEFIFASVPVLVGPRVSAVSLSTENLTLHLSDADNTASVHQIQATISPDDALCQDIIWTSSDESIATVDENGLIHALKPGTVTIRATSAEIPAKDQKAKTRSCSVTVIRDVASIELSEPSLRIKKTGTATLKATVLPENASNQKISWESSDSSIASITSAGQITAKTCGACTITAKATDGSEVLATCELTVFQPVTSLKPAQTSIKAFLGSAPTQAEVSVSPSDATDKSLTWSSSNPEIATVDEFGNVTAVSGGSCKIICTSNDGTNKSAEISVLVPSISVEKTDYVVTEKKGLTIPLKYFGQDIGKLKLSVTNRSFFTAKLEADDEPCIIIKPERTGKTTITLNDSTNEKNAVKLNIEISSSASFDSTAYPRASYEKILRYPEQHNGKQYQIYGKVLQKTEASSYTILRVGTSGGFYDSVFYVTYSQSDIDASVIEEDYVTIHGICNGTQTYESIWGQSITIPYIIAERIKIGRK